jgi:hypothetical protein
VGSGFDYADDGDGKGAADVVEGECGGGVAGDDDVLGVHFQQKFDDLADESANDVGGFVSVGEMGGVTEIDEVLGREGALEGADDGEATEAAIEDGDRIGCIHGLPLLIIGRGVDCA